MSSEIDPKDFASLEKVVNDAAARASAVWLSFITLTAYMIITTGSVTHRDLLLDTSIKLPVLSVDLPLVGFFVVAPILFVISHFYFLLQLTSLHERIMDYERILRDRVPREQDRYLLRYRLDSFVFVPLLAGHREYARPAMRFMHRLIASMSAIGAPILTLLFMEFTFLPYHHHSLTWFHRLMVLVDVVVAAFIWLLVDSWTGRGRAAKRFAQPAVAGLIVAVLAIVVSVAPGEVSYKWFHSPLTRWMFEGDVNAATGRPDSFFANHLILSYQPLRVTPSASKDDNEISLRGRDLLAAVLRRADLSRVDFTGALLTGADLSGTVLTNAKFDCAESEAALAERRCTDLRGANLSEAKLDGASFNRADLQGANLTSARLNHTVFDNARLNGADFTAALFHHTSLTDAQLNGASLSTAHSFDPARAENANFHGAWLGTMIPPIDPKNVPEGAVAGVGEDLACDGERLALWTQLRNSLCNDPDKENIQHIARGIVRNRNLIHTGRCACNFRFPPAEPNSCNWTRDLTRDDLALLNQYMHDNNIACPE